MYDDLVTRLRDAAKMSEALAVLLPHSEGNATAKLYNEAADAIENMSEAYGKLSRHMDDLVALMPRWIPVSERLPEIRHDVLVYAGVLFPYITVGYYDGLWKFSYNDEEIAGSADYWMPLPEQPKEE